MEGGVAWADPALRFAAVQVGSPPSGVATERSTTTPCRRRPHWRRCLPAPPARTLASLVGRVLVGAVPPAGERRAVVLRRLPPGAFGGLVGGILVGGERA